MVVGGHTGLADASWVAVAAVDGSTGIALRSISLLVFGPGGTAVDPSC